MWTTFSKFMDLLSFDTFTHCVCVVDIGRVQFMGLFIDGIMMNRCHCFLNRSLRSHQSCLGKRRKIGKVWVISKRTRVSYSFGVSRGFTKLICATLIFIATWCVLRISWVRSMSIIYNNDMNSWCYYIHMYMMFISYHVQYTLSTIIVKFKHVWENHQDLTPQKKESEYLHNALRAIQVGELL